MGAKTHSHQPGSLKQSNKKHKSLNGNRAKQRMAGPGKVQAGDKGKGGKKLVQKGGDYADAKQKRVDRATQMRKNKHADTVAQKRLGSLSGPPKIVGVICLSRIASASEVLEMCAGEGSWSNLDTVDTDDSDALVHVSFNKHKTRMSFVTAQCDDIDSVLHAARVSDVLVLAVKVPSYDPTQAEFIDAAGYTAVSALKAFGMPEVLCCVQGYEHHSGKKLADTKKLLTRTLQACVDPEVRIAEATKPDLMCRTLCNIAPRKVFWRAERSYMLADKVSVSADVAEGAAAPTVCVSGYLRGQHMALHSLVHIPGVGTGRVARVHGGRDPFPSSRPAAMTSDANTLLADPALQDPLDLEADATGLDGEQTWPTEEEMDEAMRNASEGAGRNRRNVPTMIPNGMSSYQADWFQDEDGKFDVKTAVGSDPDLPPAPPSSSQQAQADDDVDMDEGGSDDGDDMTLGGSMLDGPYIGGSGFAEKQRLRALADSDMQFPDEKDTPMDQKARERFARYRALESFRSSPWHPKENLPADYSRIYQFENFPGVQRRYAAHTRQVEAAAEKGEVEEDDETPFSFKMPVEQEDDEMEADEQAEVVDNADAIFLRTGAYVTVEVDGLSAEAAQLLQGRKSVQLFGLQRHENRLSVLHFTIKRSPGYAEVIKGKEPLLFNCGFRSFEGRPIFSESNLNCDKHKAERFLAEDCFSTASVYGPITFMPCPLLLFKRLANGQLLLVATGSMMKVDPDRIMLKKVILTGIPIRVRKRTAVVKHMLYDTNDVRWFKPAELVTKMGLRGHIKEPIGTHGLFKCLFSTPITQNDTIMLILYKRVYPKFPEGGVVTVR